jgi:tRNA1Val (adenine37-N6)-methyltransferase
MWLPPQEQAGIDMAQNYFAFKKFMIHQHRSAMKVTTPACLFGAWCAEKIADKNYKNGLDIGTGTGLLSLMIAQKAKLRIDAVEIDKNAALQAADNFTASGFNEPNLISGDIKTLQLPVYDCIFSNPPFYENELKSPDAGRNIAHHSENLSWEQLFSFIKEHLTTTGKFFLLLPLKRISELEKLSSEKKLFIHEVLKVRPSPAQQPLWIMVEGGKERSTETESEMFIKNGDEYSPGFTALLKDYYLKL